MYLISNTIIIVIIIIIIYYILTYNINDDDDDDDDYNDNVTTTLYEGKSLYYPAIKKLQLFNNNNNNNKKRDCNSNLVECKNDTDCKNNCIQITNYQKRVCISGLCQYVKKSSKTPLCQNGGQMTTKMSTFMYGRLITSCICPENYIGLYCQIPNEMKSSYTRTFELLY